MKHDLDLLLTGGIALAALLASLIFLKYWRKTFDRFFLLFAVAFALDGVTRFVLGLITISDKVEPFFYLSRLLTFAIIIAAIVDKNRSKAS